MTCTEKDRGRCGNEKIDVSAHRDIGRKNWGGAML